MFAMLNGAWPRVAEDGTDIAALEAAVVAGSATSEELEAAVEALVGEVVRAQEAAGFDVVTDGAVRWADGGEAVLRALADNVVGPQGLIVGTWSATAALTDRVVAAVIPGPYSLAERVKAGRPFEARQDFTWDMARALGAELGALAAAGCRMVVVEEPSAVSIGDSAELRELFLDAQKLLLAPAPDLHAMLAIIGGSAWEAGADTIYGAPYRSYVYDLIAGPDNWHLVRAAPGDRGIVCAALRAEREADQSPELVWAARFAASSMGRGLDRVGLANATPLSSLTPAAARGALQALSRAVALAELSPEEAVAAGLDPRSFRQPSRPPRRVRKP